MMSSTIKVSLLYLSCFCSLIGLAVPSHFRGGIIQWRPANALEFDGRIEITHRIAWKRSRYSCDETTITSRNLIAGEGILSCRSGCSGTVGSMSFYCTGFSILEDWTTGERTYTYNATEITSFEASFSGGNWLSTLVHGRDGGWELRVKGNLTARNDTGSINSSPISSAPLTVRIQYGCNHTIQIPVADIDGDDVRCRWAEQSQGECAGVCRAINATLFGCNIQYTANETTGLYVAALQIEDFASTTDTVPLSSIPLQFIIEVFNSTAACASKQPEIVGSTRCIEVSSTYQERIVAKSGASNISIVDIITASAVNLLKSSLNTSTTPQQWFVDVTWTPSSSQSGPNTFCYYALDSVGLYSPLTCIILLVVQAPQLLRSSISPTGLVDPSETQWSMEFDRQFRRPTSNRFIRIYDASTNTEIVTIDVSTSSAVTYPTTNSGRTLYFSTNYTFIYGATYYLLLDPGVALGDQYCHVESAAVHDPTFWTFTVGVFLSSEVYGTSVDPNRPCSEDTLVYTCTTSGVLTWTVGTTFIGAYIRDQGTTFVGATRMHAFLPGIVANLTNTGETFLTSTLTISSAGTVGDMSEIICEGLSGIRNGKILRPVVQQLIGLSGRNQTTTSSIHITITFNLSIANNVDIRGTATPADDNSSSIMVTIPGPITTPELNVSFTGLHSGTTYSIAFKALRRDNSLACLGVGISDLFLQTDHPTDNQTNHQTEPSGLTILSTGAAVGIPIAISLVSFFAGALLVVLITCCCGKRKKKSTGQLQVSYVHPSPIYSEVEPKQLDLLEMNENVAYGPVRH